MIVKLMKQHRKTEILRMSSLIDSGSVISPQWNHLQLALTTSGIEIQRENEVQRYLDVHPDMFDLVEGIGQSARQEFGADAVLVLDVYQDPEIADEYLVLYVRLSTYGHDILARVRSVADSFDDRLCMSSGSILVTTDFRSLR
jgi:hypothetical protein